MEGWGDYMALSATIPWGTVSHFSFPRSKLEPPSQGSVVSKGLVVEAGGKELESSTGGEELGQLRMM